MWLYVNPKGESRRWNKYLVVPKVTTEVVLLADVDGDGKPELVYGGDGILAYAKPDPANPTAPWTTPGVPKHLVLAAVGPVP